MSLHKLLLQSLDCAIASSEWVVADDLLRAMEDLCDRDENDPRLVAAYMRVVGLGLERKGR